MNRLIILLLLFSCGSVHEKDDQDIKVLTLNIRYDNPNDGDNNWHHRKAELCHYVAEENPDIFGLQEALWSQLAYVDSSFTSYSFVGVGRDDRHQKGEASPIFYRKGRFDLIKTETFYLSETPDSISVGWDAALERICTMVVLHDRFSDKDIAVYNVHYDHRGVISRRNASKLILSKIGALKSDMPVVLMGDFNAEDTDEAITAIASELTDAIPKDAISVDYEKGTFNGFEAKRETGPRIDYIFSKNLNQQLSKIDYQLRSNGAVISDHYPVVAVFKNKD